jgi:hypothetical protein
MVMNFTAEYLQAKDFIVSIHHIHRVSLERKVSLLIEKFKT